MSCSAALAAFPPSRFAPSALPPAGPGTRTLFRAYRVRACARVRAGVSRRRESGEPAPRTPLPLPLLQHIFPAVKPQSRFISRFPNESCLSGRGPDAALPHTHTSGIGFAPRGLNCRPSPQLSPRSPFCHPGLDPGSSRGFPDRRNGRTGPRLGGRGDKGGAERGVAGPADAPDTGRDGMYEAGKDVAGGRMRESGRPAGKGRVKGPAPASK